jgi:hypothetical protein
MRAEASKLSTDVGTLGKRYETLKLHLGQLAYEDTVDEDRDAGLRRKDSLTARLAHVKTALSETEQYSLTLNHMRNRSDSIKISQMAQLQAFEDAIAVNVSEAELAEGVLRTVNKARDEELKALAALHADLRNAISTLDKKLEARRLEVKSRQERAHFRLAKLQEELALKAQAEGDMTEEEERAMIEKAKNLSCVLRAAAAGHRARARYLISPPPPSPPTHTPTQRRAQPAARREAALPGRGGRERV